MGREIRRVPPNWKHPQLTEYNPWKRREETNYIPLYDEPYGPAMGKWIEQHLLWERGEHPDQKDEVAKEFRYYARWAGDPPKVTSYRPDWTPEEATWYQVYETVSEGTPVTPPFATKEELVDYLVANGDFWDQENMIPRPWKRAYAEAFVFGSGYAPSFAVVDGHIMTGVEALLATKGGAA